MSERKATTISDFVVGSGPDENGADWFVDLYWKGHGTWLLPVEARKLAKALLMHANQPKRKPGRQLQKSEGDK